MRLYKYSVCLALFLFFQGNIVNGQFQVINIPDDKLMTIKLDGEMEDWNWIPEKFILTNEDLCKPAISNGISSDDFSVRLRLAWNELKNWLYIVIEVQDDYLQLNTEKKDKVSVRIDPFNRRTKYKNWNQNNSFMTGFSIWGIKSGQDYKLKLASGSKWFLKDASYTKVGYQNYTDKETGKNITVYEIGMLLWGEWDKSGREQSKAHQLETNQKLSMYIQFSDVDESGGIKHTIGTCSDYVDEWWVNSSNYPYIILLPDVRNLTFEKRLNHIILRD